MAACYRSSENILEILSLHLLEVFYQAVFCETADLLCC